MEWVGAALGISLLAAIFFRRFDPALRKVMLPPEPELLESPFSQNLLPAPVTLPVDLSPLTSRQRSFFPGRILLAELRLLFKGMRW